MNLDDHVRAIVREELKRCGVIPPAEPQLVGGQVVSMATLEGALARLAGDGATELTPRVLVETAGVAYAAAHHGTLTNAGRVLRRAGWVLARRRQDGTGGEVRSRVYRAPPGASTAALAGTMGEG